jgi:Icc-related predicted phosphoesterase
MKFVLISDTHGKHAGLKLPKGDVLIHAGDVTFNGNENEVKEFLDWFEKQHFKHKIFIAGNHDFYFERASVTSIQSIIPPNLIYLNDSGVNIEGFNIWGSPVTPWFFNWAFNKHRGAAIRRHWDLIPDQTDILITHGPVFKTLDENNKGEHVGCKDLLQRVQTIKPKIHVCGHIHESYGLEEKLDIKFINCSVLNEEYRLVNRPIVLELKI